MTQQYLAGELSLLLGRLQAATPDAVAQREVARLRRAAETAAIAALPCVAARALALTDALCWHSLSRADTVAFCRQARVGAELFDFARCSGLLEDV
ncbi:hypothetical protein [Nonomuraea basaltis]|uniref:hypothetical protein n=1 Tax=Nonomuraea basaltis TaxID=2495887 RepID=UPI00110C4919|nr:hypothetical protein [Nonomuraea basaltis]TMR90142.1 hypothetical protein EJK15_56875 [Nonomuraea basaltis]